MDCDDVVLPSRKSKLRDRDWSRVEASTVPCDRAELPEPESKSKKSKPAEPLSGPEPLDRQVKSSVEASSEGHGSTYARCYTMLGDRNTRPPAPNWDGPRGREETITWNTKYIGDKFGRPWAREDWVQHMDLYWPAEGVHQLPPGSYSNGAQAGDAS